MPFLACDAVANCSFLTLGEFPDTQEIWLWEAHLFHPHRLEEVLDRAVFHLDDDGALGQGEFVILGDARWPLTRCNVLRL
jgi:hypothetical protein